ncbi:MAG: YigZ family protein [Paludibacter sp.]|nr:YigZ family protein [Paludibacter sp.]
MKKELQQMTQDDIFTNNDTFFTLKELSCGLYKDKGSRFLSFAMPVCDAKSAMNTLTDYRKRFYDARHICFAYKIGTETAQTRVNDDGEPSGTAGQPILGQINSANLTNVMIIVVRYFGGILLGTGGLRQAYKTAAADALQKGDIVEQIIENQINIKFEYSTLNNVMRIVKDYDLKIINLNLMINCTMQISVRKAFTDIIMKKFKENNIFILQD